MKNFRSIFCWILVLISCQAQEKTIESITCKSKVKVQYEKTSDQAKREGLVSDKNLEAFTVYFLSDFDDQIKAYVNEELIFDEKVRTDDVSGKSNKSFGYNYSKETEIPILKIVSEKEENCFDLRIDKNYKLIYIFISDNDKWTVRYSNTYYAEN